MLILTGQRRDEVAAMEWAEVDTAAALWRLPAERTKNRRAHEVPLSLQATAVLTDRERDGRTYVFGRDAGAPFSGYSAAKRRLDTGSGVVAWTLHDLRRTAVTGMVEIGIAPHVVEAIVNHVSGAKGGVAGIYNRALHRPEKAKALQRWADHIERVVSDTKAASVVPLAGRR
jgi:integrase